MNTNTSSAVIAESDISIAGLFSLVLALGYESKYSSLGYEIDIDELSKQLSVRQWLDTITLYLNSTVELESESVEVSILQCVSAVSSILQDVRGYESAKAIQHAQFLMHRVIDGIMDYAGHFITVDSIVSYFKALTYDCPHVCALSSMRLEQIVSHECLRKMPRELFVAA